MLTHTSTNILFSHRGVAAVVLGSVMVLGCNRNDTGLILVAAVAFPMEAKMPEARVLCVVSAH